MAFSNSDWNSSAFSAEPNLQHMFTIVGRTSPSEQSTTTITRAFSDPACSSIFVPGLTWKLAHTFSVFSRRISRRILPLVLCLSSLIGPSPRSFHSPSTNRYDLDLASKSTSSFSSPDATSTFSSFTNGVNSALHSASAAAASAASSPSSAAAALGADANTLGSNVAAAPPKPPVAPKPNTGGGAGVSSFFSSTALGRRAGRNDEGERSRGLRRSRVEVVSCALASGARRGTARSAGGGDLLRDRCAKTQRGTGRRRVFSSAGDDSEVGTPDGRAASSGTRRRTGVSAGAESLMVLLRSSGACERVARSARGGRSRGAARAFSIAGIGRRARQIAQMRERRKSRHLVENVGTPRRTGGAQLWCPPPPRTPSRRRCGSRCWWPRRGVRWTPSTSPRPSSRCACPASRRMRPRGGHARTCPLLVGDPRRGTRASREVPFGATSWRAIFRRAHNPDAKLALGAGCGFWVERPPGGSGAGASPALEALICRGFRDETRAGADARVRLKRR